MSVGRPGRRIIALAIDWALAYALAALFYRSDGLAITLIFMAMQVLFIPTIGGSIGHRVVGLRVVAVRGGWIGVWRPVVRTLLLALVIPAGIWDSDQRGFHDKIAGTVLLRI
ncbi:RDD family protein [Glaciibacter sp. 2TAF33]